jgi:hypothetical protein
VKIWQNGLGQQPSPKYKPTEVGLMIDEINYFPERENYQKKKKADEDWKELKKQKIIQDSKKAKKPDTSPKPKPDPKKK